MRRADSRLPGDPDAAPGERDEEQLLESIRREGGAPVALRDLLRDLGGGRRRQAAWLAGLRRLHERGLIETIGRNRYRALRRGAGKGDGEARSGARGRTAREAGERAPGRRAGEASLTGTLQVHGRGFGFVVPDGGGQDLFVPPGDVGDRSDGDRVEARITRQGADGRLQGVIVRTLERTRRRVVGLFRAGPSGPADGGRVEAYDRRFEAGIVVPAGEAGATPDGLVVGVEILRPAGEGRPARGRIVEVIGPPDAPGTELRSVIRKFGLREDFPADAMAEAERAPDRVRPGDLQEREDFRSRPIVTIDGETARDFDDAVTVRRRGDGGFDLEVHIADVAHYVRPGTALDREAFERGTSVYFPGSSLPMLPHRLSNGICSLNPGVDRLVQSCLMTIDAHGQVVADRLASGVIRSAARMTYTHVARILTEGDPDLTTRYRDLVPLFRDMEALCRVLNARRLRRGSIDFDLPEPELLLAATGEMTGVLAVERNIAHRIIEEFMLAANETVARRLWTARLPSLYRVHERPDPRRLEEFDAVARSLGYVLPRPFETIEPGAFQGLLERAKGRPEERFLATTMLRSMKQARYSERRERHFGLASSCYTHFTSPIRRYPDLVVHRLVGRLRDGAPLDPRERAGLEETLPDVAARSSVRERTADAAENELIERKKMAFMAERVGEEFQGFVSRVEPFGLFVELREFFVQGLIPIARLGDDRYRFVERRRVLAGERRGRVFAMGDEVRVRIAGVDQFRLEIDFELLQARPGARAPVQAPGPRPGHGPRGRPRREGRRRRR